ncbi:MAG: ISAzo13 family transposase, partial [Cyanobacteria bacterium J06573_11]
YNPIERCWAALEQFWSGAILDSIETTLEWASRMMWKGFEPIVYHLRGTYEKGITVDPQSLAEFRVDWQPSKDLPKWAITIQPT